VAPHFHVHSLFSQAKKCESHKTTAEKRTSQLEARVESIEKKRTAQLEARLETVETQLRTLTYTLSQDGVIGPNKKS
jgi:uncharacterized protein YceH (UPF0502 family)